MIILHIRNQFNSDAVKIVDMVFDIYKKDSLKAGTWQKRGKGIRRNVEGTHMIPGNWQEFLREDDNTAKLM